MKKEKLTSKWSLKKPLYLEKTDDRYKKYAKQLKETGFCNPETWSLYSVIAEFTLPRLKMFRRIYGGYPMGLTEKKWDEILDKMIFSFEWSEMEDSMTEEYEKMTDKEKKIAWKKYDEGMNLFIEYFRALWW
jgi:hypothetical protein